MTPHDFIEKHTSQAQPLKQKASLAFWQASLSGSQADFQKQAELELALRRIYSNKDEYRMLQGWIDSTSETNALQRQLTIAKNLYAENQLEEPVLENITRQESEIERIFNTFRPSLNGQRITDNDINHILRTSSDSEHCRSAWEAGKRIGEEMSDRILELVSIRNAASKKLGYANYYRMQYELKELDIDFVFQTVDQLSRDTEAAFLEFKRQVDEKLAEKFGLPADKLSPWHYGDPFFQEVPQDETISFDDVYETMDIIQAATHFYETIGLSVSSILKQSDLYEQEGKCQHAFCLAVDAPTDVRVLCNLKNTERWAGTLLHELGHAVYDTYLNPELPWLLRRPAHAISTEAVALLMGRLALNRDWLRQYARLGKEHASIVAKAAWHKQRNHQLLFSRWVSVMMHFERDLYENPHQNLNRLWWDYVERFQHLRRPENRDAPDWAAKIHLAVAPVYYQNYILGELYASQVSARIKAMLGGESYVSNPRLGAFLKREIFESGRLYDWNETLRRATGDILNPQNWLNEFVLPDNRHA